ncbi:hypothetical protein FQN52_001249 [Onygenales sp. PD_12]|nr:hypothetical protein FQN52_001249 [Onygenales sp. PD_12]
MAKTATKHDPFKLLNFDCINIIFRDLTPIEILRCSLVSRTFREWAHSFIITDGLNHHFAHYTDTGDFNSDSLSPVKRYAQFAQLQRAFKQGKPSSVLKFPCSDELKGMESDDSRDVMVQLKGPRFMWHHDYPDAREWPLCIGKESIYYLTTIDGPALLAYDIKTGHRLYRSALPDKIDLRLGSPVFQLLRDEMDEILAFQSLTEPHRKLIIFMVNGSNGQTFQELDIEGRGLSRQHAKASTLVLQRYPIIRQGTTCSVLLFDKFSRCSSGLFARTSTNAFIFSMDISFSGRRLWIDTLRRLASVILLNSGEVKVLEIEEHPSPLDCYKKFGQGSEDADNWFIATERDHVSLPKEKGPENLKTLVVQGPRLNVDCTVCDDRRLVFQTAHGFGSQATQTRYLLDFTPKPNHSKPGIYRA